MTGLPPSVDIREVGPRDGLQIEAPLSTGQKLAMIAALAATGVRRIEVTSFVSPRAVPSMADAEQVAAALGGWPGIEWSALVLSERGARRALTAGIGTLEYVVSASDGHSAANARRTTEQASALIATIAASVHDRAGRLEVIIATAWDCPFDGPTPPDRVLRVARAAAAAGADRLCLADTIGTTTPVRMLGLIEAVRAEAPGLDVGVHLHDTRGSGIANAFAAIQAGVRSLDASVGGLGGCPFAPGASGNIATEELVYLLEECGVDTGIELDALVRAAGVTEKVVGHPLSSSLYRAGGRPRPRPRDAEQRAAEQRAAEQPGTETRSAEPASTERAEHGSA